MITIYENFVSNIFKKKKKKKNYVTFCPDEIDTLNSLGFTNFDYDDYDPFTFYYKPIIDDNIIKNIKIKTYYSDISVRSYEIQITQKNGNIITKIINDTYPIQNPFLFKEIIEIINSYIPELYKNINKYNL